MTLHRFQIALVPALMLCSSPVGAESPGRALAALPWTVLLRNPSEHVAVEYRIVDTPTGYAVAFRNRGETSIHFGFWLNGWQSKDAALTNGRVHLPPGEESGPIPVAIRIPGRPLGANCPIKLIHVTQGEGGQGPFWQE
jgi:hypothetical protein